MTTKFTIPTKCKTCDGSGNIYEITGHLWWKKKRFIAWCGECIESGRMQVRGIGGGGGGGIRIYSLEEYQRINK